MSAGQDDRRELERGSERGPQEGTPGRGAGAPREARGERGGLGAGGAEVARLRAALEAVQASLPPDLAPDLALMRRLQRSEARYKVLVELSSTLVWVRDAHLGFVQPSAEWERFTGQRWEEYRGRGWLEAIHPEDRERVRTKLDFAIEAQQPMIRVRYRLRHHAEAGPEWRHVEVTASPVRDEAGEVVEWVGMVRDRTEQHEWEAERARQAEQLARSNRDLEDFAFIAAHDLKEPLRGIRLTASFLEEDSRGKLDEGGRHRLEQLHELCGRMQLLLDSLLESARVASAPLEMEWVELPALVADAAQLVGARVKETGTAVEVHESARGVRLWGDRTRLSQVVSNLIANAIKYNESPEKRVVVGVVGQAGGFATVSVRDNGIGVPADKQESVFRMFRRLHPRECYGGGAGAGLAIVKKIVERHGGRVWLESEGVGRGSTVKLTVPTVACAPPGCVPSLSAPDRVS